MLVSVWRTIFVRVRSDALIEFKSVSNNEADTVRGFFATFRASWSQDYSLFSWAETGQWQTVEIADEETRREGNWFRIGFEPLFVDYTKLGSFFAVAALMEVLCWMEGVTYGRTFQARQSYILLDTMLPSSTHCRTPVVGFQNSAISVTMKGTITKQGCTTSQSSSRLPEYRK